MYSSEGDIKELQLSAQESRLKKVTVAKPNYIYKLGEIIANNVKFWGQKITHDNGHITAMCICPLCKKAWRVDLTSVRNETTKSCGCMKGYR